MARIKVDESDASINRILDLLDRDIAQGKIAPVQISYFEEIQSLVEGVAVDLDQTLPDDDQVRKH
ncbi:MAG: type II toxin-antitoxin system PrlF family antitoxin [Arenimonas sp.]